MLSSEKDKRQKYSYLHRESQIQKKRNFFSCTGFDANTQIQDTL